MRANVENARLQLDRLRVALASPSPRDIAEGLPVLERAVASVRAIERELAHGEAPSASLGLELIALSREVGIVRRLMDHGLELCNGWAVMLANAAGGYVASGQPVSLNPRGTSPAPEPGP